MLVLAPVPMPLQCRSSAANAHQANANFEVTYSPRCHLCRGKHEEEDSLCFLRMAMAAAELHPPAELGSIIVVVLTTAECEHSMFTPLMFRQVVIG